MSCIINKRNGVCMKRLVLSLMIFCAMAVSANASEVLNIPYKNIKEEQKIKVENDTWTDKVSRRDNDYIIKFTSEGTGNYSEYYSSKGDLYFNSGTQYEFIYKGDLIGYSNHDLKFYSYTPSGRSAEKRELTEEEIQAMFPDFKIVKISEFSQNTNSLKVKKDKRNLKLILLNDTDKYFYHYSFTSGNSKFETYPLRGFLNIAKKGMIQFAHFGENTESNPWYILLVR